MRGTTRIWPPLAVLVMAVCLLAATLVQTTSAHSSPSGPADPSSVLSKARHKCHGHAATIVGNRHRNTIVGTKHRDVIWAGAGRDRVLGRAGRDLICGGKGSDVIDGMRGMDKVYAGKGTDWCIAWSHREHHRFHHNCEVHLMETKPPRHPSKNAPVAAVSRIGLADQVLNQRASSEGSCGTQCDAGKPACTNGLVDYENAQSPTAFIRDDGFLALYWQVWKENTDGSWTAEFNSGWETTQLLAGGARYAFDPAPIKVFAPDISYGGTTLVMAWWSYSADGSNWSPLLNAVATDYYAYLGGDVLLGSSGGCFV